MTQEHDALRDLIAPVALGAAAPHEIARVEGHAAECAVCREELASLRAAADVLAVAVPLREPSADLKASIMKVVNAEAGERQEAAAAGTAPPTAPAPRPGPARRRWFGMPAWPVAATIASVVVLLIGWGVVTQVGSDDKTQVTTLALQATPDAPGVTGRVLLISDEDTAVVTMSNLPQLPEGDAYQLWLIKDGVPKSAGLFENTGPSAARTVATGLGDAEAIAVTAQPRTSRTTPKPPILLQASL